jgi:P27 family predicted phage terminase small subunit
MAKGRKKLPDQLKVISGTFQKCRSSKSGERQNDEPMEAPEGLSEGALKHFETLRWRIALLGLDSSTYTEVLTLAAMRLEEIDACNQAIVDHGALIMAKTVTGGELLRANPAVSMRNEAMRHLQSLLAEFGLSPSSIGKVGAKKKEPEKKQGFGGL